MVRTITITACSITSAAISVNETPIRTTKVTRTRSSTAIPTVISGTGVWFLNKSIKGKLVMLITKMLLVFYGNKGESQQNKTFCLWETFLYFEIWLDNCLIHMISKHCKICKISLTSKMSYFMDSTVFYFEYSVFETTWFLTKCYKNILELSLLKYFDISFSGVNLYFCLKRIYIWNVYKCGWTFE